MTRRVSSWGGGGGEGVQMLGQFSVKFCIICQLSGRL